MMNVDPMPSPYVWNEVYPKQSGANRDQMIEQTSKEQRLMGNIRLDNSKENSSSIDGMDMKMKSGLI